MPRPPRAVVPGQLLHITQRGNNRTACFFVDDDRTYFLRALLRTSTHAGCRIHAYVLMTNHVHLLVTATHARSASQMMQSLGGRYVRFFNDRYERTGTLWEGRFRSSLVDSEHYFLACSRYIETNPVRAGIASHVEHYRWSSFRCNGEGRRDDLVTHHDIYTSLGRDGSSRRRAYRALFAAPFDPNVIHSIRRATNAQTVLGTAQFRASLEAKLRRSLERAGHGGNRRHHRGLAREAHE
jgi:putative transposase